MDCEGERQIDTPAAPGTLTREAKAKCHDNFSISRIREISSARANRVRPTQPALRPRRARPVIAQRSTPRVPVKHTISSISLAVESHAGRGLTHRWLAWLAWPIGGCNTANKKAKVHPDPRRGRAAPQSCGRTGDQNKIGGGQFSDHTFLSCLTRTPQMS